MSGEEIHDDIITKAMRMVMDQTTHLNIQATSLSSIPDQLVNQRNEPTIFIHHTGAHHFATSTSIGGKVRIYDSLNAKPTKEMLNHIAAIYAPGGNPDHPDAIRVQQVHIKHRQKGGTDCGVYAIAYAVDLALGVDPRCIADIPYCQSQLRAHLHSAFSSNTISQFPRRGGICLITEADNNKLGARRLHEKTTSQTRTPVAVETHAIETDGLNETPGVLLNEIQTDRSVELRMKERIGEKLTECTGETQEEHGDGRDEGGGGQQ